MNQALHILRKDIRRLWLTLSIVLAVQALFIFFEMRPHRDAGFVSGRLSAETIIDILLPLAWWYIITALIHEEPLAGDRQFWITRPYRWSSLLAAKALFILSFVNLPVLIGDCFILRAQGFSVAGHWQGILWRHIPFTLYVLLPALALGSLTRSLGQVIVAALLVILRIVVNSIPFGDSLPDGNTAVPWTEETVAAILMLAVLSTVVWIQYRARRPWLARALFAALIVFPGFSLPIRWQLAWQARVKPPALDTSPIRVAFDHARGRRTPLHRYRNLNQVSLAIPVAVSLPPERVELVANVADIDVGGRSFSEGVRLERDANGYWEVILLPANFFASLRSTAVTLRMTTVFTAVRETEFRAPLETGPLTVPDVGICESARPWPQLLNVNCRSAFRTPLRTVTHADYPGWDAPDPTGRSHEGQILGDISDSPFPAGLSLSPVRTVPAFGIGGNDLAAATNHPGTQLVFRTQHPVALFQAEFEVKSIRLEDYAIAAPEN